MEFTITLSPAEYKALGIIAMSQDEWIQNAVHERCRMAMEEIVAQEVQRKLSLGESINGTKDDIVLNAPIESAAERKIRLDAEQVTRGQ